MGAAWWLTSIQFGGIARPHPCTTLRSLHREPDHCLKSYVSGCIYKILYRYIQDPGDKEWMIIIIGH